MNYPAQQLRGLPPERPGNIPASDPNDVPFKNGEGDTTEEMARLNAEFTERWNNGGYSDQTAY